MSQAVKLGVPTPCFSTALSFYDGYRHAFFLNVNGIFKCIKVQSATAGMLICSFLPLRCKKLPANFIQAQRDYFGAHTYELLEKPGIDSNIDRHGIIDILRPPRA